MVKSQFGAESSFMEHAWETLENTIMVGLGFLKEFGFL